MATHPALQQQGLGAPVAPQQGQAAPNAYIQPNVALGAANGRITGEQNLQLAQANQAGAQAGKAQAEAQMMQAMNQGLGSPLQAGPEVTPQQVQAGQVADDLMRGVVSEEQLTAMVQTGDIDAQTAQVAMGMAQQAMMEDQARLEQQQGLGGGF